MAERLHPRRRYTEDNYGLVLRTVVITICWTAAAPDTEWAALIVGVLQATMLFGALRASMVTARTFRLILAVWVISAAATIAANVSTIPWTTNVGAVLGAVLTVAALVAILRRLLAQPTVGLSTVQGAIAAYLLIGLSFAYIYWAMAAVGSTPPLSGAGETLNSYLYFSFITLATVGYGDIVPVSDVARSSAMTEALLGQLYLVTVIAVVILSAPRRRRAVNRDDEDQS